MTLHGCKCSSVFAGYVKRPLFAILTNTMSMPENAITIILGHHKTKHWKQFDVALASNVMQ